MKNTIRSYIKNFIVIAVIFSLIPISYFIYYIFFYYNSLITNKTLDDMNLDHVNKLMIVAHPDDESFFGGAALIKDDYLVVCVTNGRNKVRSAEFKKAMNKTDDVPLIMNYEDKTFNERSNWKYSKFLIKKNLETIIKYKDWDEIVTHNANGEYGHIHHKMVHQIVTDIVEDIETSEHPINLEYFGKYYTAAQLEQVKDSLTPLNDKQNKKKEDLLKTYKSQQRVNAHIGHMNPYENWTSH